MAGTLFSMEPRNRWRKRSSRVELLSGARFRISPEPVAAAWWGEISCLPDHPGGPQVFSLELSARRSRGPDPSSLVALVLRAGFLKKKFPFFPKRLLGYWDHLFFGFCSNNSYLKSDHFLEQNSSSHSKKTTTNDYWGY